MFPQMYKKVIFVMMHRLTAYLLCNLTGDFPILLGPSVQSLRFSEAERSRFVILQ